MLELSHQQKEALNRIKSFLSSENKVFILKGYAGTGKTTLIKKLIEDLLFQNKSFSVMAPTGRAAKVLRDTTKSKENPAGFGATIHKSIYSYEDVEIVEDKEQSTEGLSYKYLYPIKKIELVGHVSIVDEASMVSVSESEHELFKFGTDQMLPDLLTFSGSSKSNKVIFVGDPAQLPPIFDKESYALDSNYFDDLGIQCEQVELTEVVRQKAESKVLHNATNIRLLLNTSERKRNKLKLVYGSDFKKIPEQDVTSKFIEDFSAPSLNSGVIISFTNKQCLSYNHRIREKYFPDRNTVQPGDILMVVKNSYGSFGLELFNGDLIQVIETSDEVDYQSASIYVNEGGERKRRTFNFAFRDIVISTPKNESNFPVRIIDSMLNDYKGSLSVDEMKALFVNFNMRFEDEQKIRKKNGQTFFKRGSDEYKEQLRIDPYMNALNVKYGYAITCHKAQGGEWDRAYVNFAQKNGLKDAHLRWAYTAITRGKNSIYAINPPDITPFQKIAFSVIAPLKNIPKNALSFGEPPETLYHGSQSHPAKRVLYYEIKNKLQISKFNLNRVDSTDYQEMYYIQSGDQEVRVDATHNAAGLFTAFKVVKGDENLFEDLIKILNSPTKKKFSVSYSPTTEVLKQLFDKVKDTVSMNNGVLAGIVEKPENYHVVYYFYLNGVYASIKFNFKSNGEITKAEPKITDMRRRDLLIPLIDQLK